jgi:hypothetical protein
LVIPAGLLMTDYTPPEMMEKQIAEAIGTQTVMAAETALGNDPRDVSQHNLGYDIESLDPRTGRLRFIEVKGRRAGADTVTVTRNEILTGINAPEKYILALVEVADGQAQAPRYVREPFGKEPDFGVTSVNYELDRMFERSEAAS